MEALGQEMTPTAEFNVWADPHAAAIVFNAGFERFLMAGLNLTHQFGIDEDTIVGLREINNPVAIFAADLFDFYLSSYQKRTSGQRVPLHDPCAILAITHPEIFTFEPRTVRVETEGRHTTGMTVVDERGWDNQPLNCQVGYAIDRDRGINIFFETMLSSLTVGTITIVHQPILDIFSHHFKFKEYMISNEVI